MSKFLLKILSVLLICCTPLTSWEYDSTPVKQSPIKQRVIALMSRLCAATGTHYTLHFVTPGNYAFDIGNDIYVDAGWLAHYTDAEAMLVLGHEMGHNEGPQPGGKGDEYGADVYGAKLLLKMHYTRAQVIQAAALFLRAPFPKTEHSYNTHPSGPHRYENIKNKL